MNIPDDPFIIELIPEFVDTWIKDLDEQFDKYLNEKNDQDLYRLAHTLKGSCFQFGLDEIANLGIELMGYCKEKDWEKASEMGPKLKESFRDVQKYVEKNYSQ